MNKEQKEALEQAKINLNMVASFLDGLAFLDKDHRFMMEQYAHKTTNAICYIKQAEDAIETKSNKEKIK